MCPHEEKLTAWLLGDLSPEEHGKLTSHLDGCASCRAVREELSRVLTPLRSGLEKDRNLRIEPKKLVASPPQRNLWTWLRHVPREGLKRAALLAVSFGALFALISTVYQKAQRETAPAGTVTHIEFRKSADEAAAPTLQPFAEATKGGPASASLSAEAESRAEGFEVKTGPVPQTELPAQEPQMPKLRRLVNTDASAVRPPAATAAPACIPPSDEVHAKALSKRERGKSVPSKRPSAELAAQPVRLAGALAPTNAAPTNAAPTNAVSPAATHTP